MSTLRVVFSLLALASACAPAQGQERATPSELVRSLRAAQDKVALGDVDAHNALRALLVDVGRQLLATKPEAWKEPGNARAAVAFVLSGGDARLLRRLVALGSLPGVSDKLLQGVLARGEGRPGDAAELLVPINARSLDPSIAGHVALVQAELVAKKDPKKAVAFLDDARLLAPGTLIEEAALRRQVGIVAAIGEFDRFEMLATNYMRRFPRSIYAAAFRRQFAADMAGRDDAAEPSRLERMAAVLEAMGPAERRDAYLSIAREALARGKVELARFAAGGAARLAEGEEADRRRAKLYEALPSLPRRTSRRQWRRCRRSMRPSSPRRIWPCSRPLVRLAPRLPVRRRRPRPQAPSRPRTWPQPSKSPTRPARDCPRRRAHRYSEQMTMSHVAARTTAPADNAVARVRDATAKGRPDEMGDADFGKHIEGFAAGREPAGRAAPPIKRDLEPRATRWQPLKDSGPQVSLPDEPPAADVEMLEAADPLLVEKPSDAAAPPLSFTPAALPPDVLASDLAAAAASVATGAGSPILPTAPQQHVPVGTDGLPRLSMAPGPIEADVPAVGIDKPRATMALDDLPRVELPTEASEIPSAPVETPRRAPDVVVVARETHLPPVAPALATRVMPSGESDADRLRGDSAAAEPDAKSGKVVIAETVARTTGAVTLAPVAQSRRSNQDAGRAMPPARVRDRQAPWPAGLLRRMPRSPPRYSPKPKSRFKPKRKREPNPRAPSHPSTRRSPRRLSARPLRTNTPHRRQPCRCRDRSWTALPRRSRLPKTRARSALQRRPLRAPSLSRSRSSPSSSTPPSSVPSRCASRSGTTRWSCRSRPAAATPPAWSKPTATTLSSLLRSAGYHVEAVTVRAVEQPAPAMAAGTAAGSPDGAPQSQSQSGGSQTDQRPSGGRAHADGHREGHGTRQDTRGDESGSRHRAGRGLYV